jgi:hypothetical protein
VAIVPPAGINLVDAEHVEVAACGSVQRQAGVGRMVGLLDGDRFDRRQGQR